MSDTVDSMLVAFCGSVTRATVLGVLANAVIPMTGYRVARVAQIQPTKVYRELRRAAEAGLVENTSRGYRLLDPDVRTLLQKRVRLYWSESWLAGEPDRAARSRAYDRSADDWFDPSRYRANPAVARRYASEIVRPPEKDLPGSGRETMLSRKRR